MAGQSPGGAGRPHRPGHDAGHMAHGDKGGHDRHAGHSDGMFQNRFWISLALTIPVLAYSELLQGLLGYQAPAFPGSRWLAPILASIIYWYGGWPFLAGAGRELGDRRPGMMTLVAMAITTAYLYSLAIDFGLVQGMAFYWELATLVVIMLLGHWMEMRAIGGAQNALNELAKLLPDMAERVTDGGSEQVPVSVLAERDLVLVRSGGRVPADGEVEDGESQVNERMITGESRPVDKAEGSGVIAGTVNGSGALWVRISRIGEGTMLAGIMRLVAEAQGSRSRAQDLADRAAYWLTIIAIAIAALAMADVIRPESREAVSALEAMGIRVAMLTGDSEEVARWVAGELGIGTYFAEVLPEHKSEKVKALQQRGATVGMVGDGVNDTPALAQANVGIAIGAGTDVARAAAGIVLVKNDPRDVVKIVELSRASYSKMVQNLAWAVGYNAIALPLAAGVFAGLGFVLPLWVGAVLMSASTIIVALNARTLRGLTLAD